MKRTNWTKDIAFDTSAFLPARRRRGYRPNQWQRFTLEMTAAEEQSIFARREEVWEECSRRGITGPGRRFDRWMVKRFGV